MKTAPGVTISLTPEWLTREDGKGGLPTEHQAEQNVLWEIEAQLERTLVEPLQPEYAELVAAARERLAAEGE